MSADNPYVGPRAFRDTETLPNRQREATELTNLLMAERVVLLHAPSGAGKTSLIQASVLKLLEQEKFRPTKALRVECPKPTGIQPRNRFSYALALDLLGRKKHDPDELAAMTLSQVLCEALGDSGRRVLILDQLEETLTLDPAGLDAKEQFFAELGDALQECSLWALLAIREDYLGALDRYLRYLPGELRVRYRLDLLDKQDALDAVQKPAQDTGITFTDDAAMVLVDRLAGDTCVEPFQLQVVCRQLWEDWRSAHGEGATTITVGDARDADIDSALGKYYDQALDDVEAEFGVPERDLRDWFEEELTDNGRRRQTTAGPVGGTRVLDRLEDAYLIRSDTRGGTKWYELSHDRLVAAVLENNRAWQLQNLDSWQVAAYEWKRRGRQVKFLLPKAKLAYAPPVNTKGLLRHEQDFLRESFQLAGDLSSAKLHKNQLRILAAIAAIELVVIIVLLATGA
ncbi:hypothetical protein Lesp02_38710 [Lentzea sp. NBRC 105346]|uniref:ATP-binding protein n=1 Tax=Lentzea sp. NBRC 105346 TaxID=3032205 RepID=UPI0024A54DE0|nr:ATP-binding protein [Lentzea sp. NBRC 105346]GLZ31683.1 hypothetical protein Lesp02_38710 [Lentzea sp. NBRC 105346]